MISFCRSCKERDQLDVRLVPLPPESDALWLCPLCGEQSDQTFADWCEQTDELLEATRLRSGVPQEDEGLMDNFYENRRRGSWR